MLKKSEVIAKIAEQTGVTKTDIDKVINAYTEVLVEEVTTGEKFTINNVGIVKPSNRKERQGRNPRTGEPMTIAASKGATLSLSKSFKEALNK